MKQDINEPRKSLVQAYLETDYCFTCSGELITIAAGEHNRRVDRLLQDSGESSWAFITAWNPYSEDLSPEVNHERQNKLQERLKDYRYFQGYGKARTGDWPAEDSLMVVGIEAKEAQEIGREFGQNAIVLGRLGRPAEVRWLLA